MVYIRLKTLGFVAVTLLIILVTISGVMAFSVDGDDKFYVKKGDSIDGMFVVENYSSDMVIWADSNWITINDRVRVVDDVYAVKYTLNTPRNTPVDVYRTHITVTDGESSEVVNVKVSVQNSFFKFLFNLYSNPILTWYIIGFFIFILAIATYLMFMGVRRRW